MDEKNFEQNGAFNINGQWATAVRYDAALDGGKISTLSVKFVNGRKQLEAQDNLTRADALRMLGEHNVDKIEKGIGREKDEGAQSNRGKLQGETLSYHQGYTAGRKPENTLENDSSLDISDDKEVKATVQRRRDQIAQRVANLKAEKQSEEEIAFAPVGNDSREKEGTNQAIDPGSDVVDRSRAVPDHVKDKFLVSEGNYYFPDQTLAFKDKGKSLATASENKEVVRSMVAIAHARGWDTIRVKGSEDFKREAWLEASINGLEVRGYNPTAIEKAHLTKLVDDQDRQQDRQLKNSVEQSKQQNRSIDSKEALNGEERNTPTAPRQGDTAQKPSARVIHGQVVAHGEAPYQNNPDNDKSYFATLLVTTGSKSEEKTVWGVDLGRAMPASGAQIGEKVKLEYMGRVPVTKLVDEKDERGAVVGQITINTHRNEWKVERTEERAKAFREDDRKDAVSKHPDLTASYTVLAVSEKVIEKQIKDPSLRQRYSERTKERIAQKIEQGESVKAPTVVKQQEQTKVQAKDTSAERTR